MKHLSADRRVGCTRKDHPRLGRRDLLQVGGMSLVGMGLSDLLRMEAQATAAGNRRQGTAKSLVFIVSAVSSTTCPIVGCWTRRSWSCVAKWAVRQKFRRSRKAVRMRLERSLRPDVTTGAMCFRVSLQAVGFSRAVL